MLHLPKHMGKKQVHCRDSGTWFILIPDLVRQNEYVCHCCTNWSAICSTSNRSKIGETVKPSLHQVSFRHHIKMRRLSPYSLKSIWVWVNTYRYIFSGMNIRLPPILMFTRATWFWPILISIVKAEVQQVPKWSTLMEWHNYPSCIICIIGMILFHRHILRCFPWKKKTGFPLRSPACDAERPPAGPAHIYNLRVGTNTYSSIASMYWRYMEIRYIWNTSSYI